MTLDPGAPDVLHIKAPNKVTFEKIGTVLAQLESCLRATSPAEARQILLDMSSVAFCSPTGITILAAAIEDLFLRGALNGGEIWMPRSPLLQQYLQRMNFFSELRVSMPPESFERREPKGFYPVTHIQDEEGAPAATRALADAVQEHAHLDEQSLGALKSCLNEVVENVFYHAQSPIEALVCAQAYKKKKRTELVIADTGRGIRAALSEVPEYQERIADDCEAIKLALEKNVTTTGDVKRGIGLWVASEVIRLNEGALLILSHDGGLLVDADGAHDVDDHFWPGTLVVIEFRTDRPINTTTVYDSGDFPDDDDSFGF
ncbi:MAG TPA: ATP-binding protein [Solirubrobacteraceae bacterium]|nr:ATP-binding protein [Solirubrobacteraceae bacterium]